MLGKKLDLLEKRISRTLSNKSNSSQKSSSAPKIATPSSLSHTEISPMMAESAEDGSHQVSTNHHRSKRSFENQRLYNNQPGGISGSQRNFESQDQDTISLADRYHRALESLKQKDVSSSSSSDDGSEFDWDKSDESGMDEAEREERRQEKIRESSEIHEIEQHIRRAKRLRKVYLSFMRLSRPIRTTLLLLLGSGLAITPTIVVTLRFPNSPAKPHVLVWSIWGAINVAASCATSIIVDFLPIVVLKLFYLLYGSTPEKLKTQVELWMNVKFWIKLALSFTWYWVILLVIFTSSFPFQNDHKLSYFDWFKKFAAALFGTALVLLIEKILLQIVKINFHKTSLKDRLEENEKALWALDKLAAAKNVSHTPKKRSTGFLSSIAHGRHSQEGSNTPGRRTGQTSAGFSGSKHDSAVIDVPISQMASSAANQNLSAKKLQKKLQLEAEKKKKRRRSANLSQVTDQLTTAIAHATMKDGRRDEAALGSTHSAKKLARKLFEGLDEDRGGVLTRNEFEPFFKNAADAAEAFKLFDKDGNGDIDRKEMRSAVSRIYRERRALATSLKDMSSAVAKLDAVLLAMALLVSLFIWLFIFNPKGTTDQLVPIATVVLGFSMLFIFSIHPYDVGDLVFIDDSPMFVLEFGLFSTTFQRTDGQVIIAPNSVLGNQKHILNVRRSGAMWETTNVMVSFDTPLEVLQEFRNKLRQYVSENSREWKGGLDVNIDFMKNQNLIQLSLYSLLIVAMEHKGNWQDWGARWDRRTLLMREMKKIMDSLNITYRLPIQVSFFFFIYSDGKNGRNGGPETESIASQVRTRGNGVNRLGSSTSNALGNSTIPRSSSEQAWNGGGIPTLRVQTNQM
ncbi:hypothetical protein PPACK8108_LOCUS20739 [Phakopsora pachyrhizi]|uniref:EF-hand domain-containing protein n=1 Tax=Phakopsora pachyrhizi TaxID=170000 RepID=A0AAV0BGN9_PHAPC|nr:hypothetical protein PPACK8108_LOCUS20739 [Phakopsora pachyrhizi]